MNHATRMLAAVAISAFLVGSPGITVPIADATAPPSEVRLTSDAQLTTYTASPQAWYVKIGAVKGEATDADHLNWTELLSVSWGIENPARSAPAYTPVAIVLQYDIASIPILKLCDQGTTIGQVKIEMTTVSQTPMLQTKYVLRNVTCSSYGVSGDAGSGHPYVSLQLDYLRMAVTYYQYDQAGQLEGARAYEIDRTQ